MPGKDKKILSGFKGFLEEHGGSGDNVVKVVADISSAFIAGIKVYFTESRITVDCFHVVQLLSKAIEQVRRDEVKKVRIGQRPPGGRPSKNLKANSHSTDGCLD